MYLKFPGAAPSWWIDCKDSIFIPRVDGKFVATLNHQNKNKESINLTTLLEHWDELESATWVMREWQCNPCGTCAEDIKAIPPSERILSPEEAKALIVSANEGCPWCNGPLDRLLDGGSYQCQPCKRTFHECIKGLPNTEIKRGTVYCVNGSGPLECECRKIKIGFNQ